MKKFLEEFKKFAIRGNVVDLAVAVIIGGAFGKIVSSLVNNIITPLLGLLVGGIDFSELSITFGAASIAYGTFIQSVVDFFIIAFTVFVAIKIINRVQEEDDKSKKEDVKKEPPEEIQLLREIRDAVKK